MSANFERMTPLERSIHIIDLLLIYREIIINVLNDDEETDITKSVYLLNLAEGAAFCIENLQHALVLPSIQS